MFTFVKPYFDMLKGFKVLKGFFTFLMLKTEDHFKLKMSWNIGPRLKIAERMT